jgi:hypothetical protein
MAMQSENGGYKMSVEKLRKFIDENKNLLGWEDTLLLNGIYNTLCDYEKQCKITALRPEMPKQNPLLDEADQLVSDCFSRSLGICDKKVSANLPEQWNNPIKLTEIMMDYIQSKQRIEATSNMAELAREYLKPKPAVTYGELTDNFIKSMATDSAYKQHEERLINSDDFLDEEPAETPDVTKSSVEMLKRALTDESGDSVTMEVLCYDDVAGLKKVTSVVQVLFVREHIADNYYVIRIVTEARPGDSVTKCGLLIS